MFISYTGIFGLIVGGAFVNFIVFLILGLSVNYLEQRKHRKIEKSLMNLKDLFDTIERVKNEDINTDSTNS